MVSRSLTLKIVDCLTEKHVTILVPTASRRILFLVLTAYWLIRKATRIALLISFFVNIGVSTARAQASMILRIFV